MARAGETVSDQSAFDLLDPRLQRQLYAMRWPALWPIQSAAIHAWTSSDDHLLIMADTAGGKTEAAFLPVLSSIAAEPHGSVRVLYVGPLKALINDQLSRLETLCTHMQVPVHRWHGDVPMSRKAALARDPGGVLLITPESIESLLINRTALLPRLVGGVRAIVIDEVHAFLESERGLHLASLLSRLSRYRAPDELPPRMIGLSATVADPLVARRYLSPDDPDRVTVIEDDRAGSAVRVRLHGYDAARLAPPDAPAGARVTDEQRVTWAIADDLVEHCRGRSNLVFANAKGDIELYADLANERCGSTGSGDRFLVHHGSLARELREETERRMKTREAQTVLCSSTLEMGIDVGAVHMVGQIGPPWSVGALKQRMGRSGRRRGEPRRLRCYVDCTVPREPAPAWSRLPLELLQMIAIGELMLEGWLEPPRPAPIDLSTLTHQVISTIAECGAIDAAALHRRLCVEGPFRAVAAALFARLLRALGAADLIEQRGDRLLILGLAGERLRRERDFYGAFRAVVGFDVVAANRILGTLPMQAPPRPGDHILFAGRRWQVAAIDRRRCTIEVEPALEPKRPRFAGSGGEIHRAVRERMRSLLRDGREPEWTDAVATRALRAARELAGAHGLARRRLLPIDGQRTLWLTWCGTAETRTLLALLAWAGIEARDEQIALECSAGEADLRALITGWRRALPDRRALARHVQPKRRRKYDELLPDTLLEEAIAAELCNVDPSAHDHLYDRVRDVASAPVRDL